MPVRGKRLASSRACWRFPGTAAARPRAFARETEFVPAATEIVDPSCDHVEQTLPDSEYARLVVVLPVWLDDHAFAAGESFRDVYSTTLVAAALGRRGNRRTAVSSRM
jgi:hypothetical protein